MRLEVVVVRGSGDILTESRSDVFFEVSLLLDDRPGETLLDHHHHHHHSPAAESPISYRTATKKRSHILDFRVKSDAIEFGDVFNIPLKEVGGRLQVVCVKKGTRIGQVVISLDSLPSQQSVPPVQKWYQLQDAQRRNISATVFLKLRLHQHSAVQLQLGRFTRHGPHTKGQAVSPVSLQSPTNLNVFPVRSGQRRQRSMELVMSTVTVEYVALLSLGSTATVLDRYPASDRPQFAFPDSTLLAGMCLPPAKVRSCCFGFLLANSSTYGTAYIFTDQDQSSSSSADPLVSDDELLTAAAAADDNDDDVRPIKALILLSRLGFGSTFHSIIIDLFDHIEPNTVRFTESVLPAIRFLCDRIPSPSAGQSALRVRSPFSQDVSWRLYIPDSLNKFELPLLDYSVVFLLRILDISTVLMAISSILTGKSIVIHSSQVSLLLPICECLLSLIFPFRWSNVYVPVLPRDILQVLDSPVPFIVGTVTSNLRSVQLAAHCVVVDVDLSTVTPESSLVLLPAQPTKVLCRQVRRAIFHNCLFHADLYSTHLKHHDLHPQPSILLTGAGNISQEREIRFCFIRYICSLLHDYRKYLRFDSANDSHFDSATFLEQRLDARPFLSRFIQTQMFTEFLELHVDTPSLLDDFLYYSAQSELRYATSPEIEIRIDSAEIDAPQPLIGHTALYYKDRYECSRAVKHSRLCLLVMDLLRTDDAAQHDPVSVSELYSVAELLCFAHWRAVFIDLVLESVHTDGKSDTNPVSQPSLLLSLDRYTALAFLFERALDQAFLSPKDFGFARKVILGPSLRIAGKLPRSPDAHNKSSLVTLRDSIKHCAIWKQHSYWEFHLSLTVLQNTIGKEATFTGTDQQPQPRKSRAESVPHSAPDCAQVQGRVRSSEEEDFIFGEICALLCLMQNLEIPRAIASQIVLALSHQWRFDSAQINDLTTLISNMYRAQPDEGQHSNRASPRFPDFGLVAGQRLRSPARSVSTLPVTPAVDLRAARTSRRRAAAAALPRSHSF